MELSRDIHAGDLADDMEAASASGDLIQVKALLEQWHAAGKRVPPDGFCCDPEDPFPMSMIAAIKNQRLDVIACFLDEGFPICAAGSATASKVGSVDVYQTFLNHGWDINELPARGCAALKFVLDRVTLRSWFLAHGADPNITDQYGHSPLTVAAACTPVSFLEQLLEHGGDPARSNALHNAVEIRGAEGIEKAALLLDYGAPINTRKYEWDQHFFDMYKRTSGLTPLHIAVARGSEDMVALLVDRGADPLVEDRFGLTPLTMATGIQQPPFFSIAEMLQRAVGNRSQEV